MIKLTIAKQVFDGEQEKVIWVNPNLISTMDEDEFGTWILIPPYQKPVKVRESLKKLINQINGT